MLLRTTRFLNADAGAAAGGAAAADAGTAGGAATGTEAGAAAGGADPSAAAADAGAGGSLADADGWEVESHSVGTLVGDAKKAVDDAGAAAGAAENDGRERDAQGRFVAQKAGDQKTAEPGKGKQPRGNREDAIKAKDAEAARWRREAEGRAEENRRLQERIAQLERAGASPAAAAAQAKTEAKTGAESEPKKFSFPTWEQFAADPKNEGKTYEDFLDERQDARTAFTRAEAATRDAAARSEQEQQEIDRAHFQRVREFIAEQPDFNELMQAHGRDLPKSQPLEYIVSRSPRGPQILYALVTPANHAAARVFSTFNMPRLLADQIAESPLAEQLVVHFGSNPDAYRDLLAKKPPAALRALVDLETTLGAARAPSPSGPARGEPPVTRAARPIRPVGGGPGVGDTSPDPDDMEFGPEWIKAENQRIAGREAGRRL